MWIDSDGASVAPRGERISVLFFAPSAYPLGGVADWLDYALCGLSDRGLTCRVALVDGGGHDAKRYLERHPWPQTRLVCNPTGSFEGRIAALSDAISADPVDVVVSINLVDVYEAVRRLRLSRSAVRTPRVAMALHGLQGDLTADIARQRDVIDAVIATNRLSCKLAEIAIADSSRVRYAPYGVPLSEGPDSARPQASAPRLRLLYAGRVEQGQKRVLDLPPLLSGLRRRGLDASVSIAGGGPDESALRSALTDEGVASNVLWLGTLNGVDLARAYREHDALVITSVWETGPIVAWEAMSHGLPVISSRYVGAGLEGALRNGVNSLLFDVGNIEAAVAAVARLKEPELRRRIVEGGLKLVSKCYSRQRSIEAWCSALSSITKFPARAMPSATLLEHRGRLDRLLGSKRAETVRSLLGIRFAHSSPGSAWPHTGSNVDEDAFLRHARDIDVTIGSLDNQLEDLQ